jgi:hypothetical protein
MIKGFMHKKKPILQDKKLIYCIKPKIVHLLYSNFSSLRINMALTKTLKM